MSPIAKMEIAIEIPISILIKNWDRDPDPDRNFTIADHLGDKEHMLCQSHEKLRQQLANQKLKTFLPAFFEIVRKFEGYLAFCKITTKIYV